MIEVVAAVSAATGAFNTIKAGFAAGREIETMAGDLSRWMGSVSDIKKAEEYNKKPMYDAEITTIALENSLGSIGGVPAGIQQSSHFVMEATLAPTFLP